MAGNSIKLADLDVLIRPMQEGDWQETLGLIHYSIQILNSNDYTPEEVEIVVGMYTLQEISTWKMAYVAQYGDKIVGVIGGYCEVWSLLRIQGLFVHPNYIRRKIGSKLLRKFEEISTLEKGIKGIVVASSLTAQDFYIASGYELAECNDPLTSYLTTTLPVASVDSVPTVRFLKTVARDEPETKEFISSVFLFIILSLLLLFFLFLIL